MPRQKNEDNETVRDTTTTRLRMETWGEERAYTRYIDTKLARRKWIVAHAQECTIKKCPYKDIYARILVEDQKKGRIKKNAEYKRYEHEIENLREKGR